MYDARTLFKEYYVYFESQELTQYHCYMEFDGW